jgi:hypothetical protein
MIGCRRGATSDSALAFTASDRPTPPPAASDWTTPHLARWKRRREVAAAWSKDRRRKLAMLRALLIARR